MSESALCRQGTFLFNKTSCPAPMNPNKDRSYQVTGGEIWVLSANTFHQEMIKLQGRLTLGSLWAFINIPNM